MAEAGICDHLRHLVADCHDFSWFTTRFSSAETLCHTAAGSRPGESLADVIYAFVLHKVLRKVRADVERAGLTVEVPCSGDKVLCSHDCDASERLDGPAWADDVTFVCAHADPELLVAQTGQLASVVLNACCAHGMSPNLKKGKTSVTICIRGRGSRKVRKATFAQPHASLAVPTSQGVMHLHIVPTYVHLGCAVDKDMSFETEAHRRTSMAHASFNSYQAILFQNRAVPLHVRGSLLSVFVESTLFNAALWDAEAEKGYGALCKGFNRLVKRLLVKDLPHEEYLALCVAEVTLLTEHPPLHITMRGRRLQYLRSLLQAAPNVLWALVQAESQWGRRLLADLEWLQKLIGDPLPPIGEAHWSCWWHLLTGSPGRLRAWVKKALYQDTLTFAFDGLRSHHDDALLRRVAREFPQARAAPTGNVWMCVPCKKAFSSKCNLACHFFRTHKRIAAHRRYVGGTVCPCCKFEYHDKYRIHRHLQFSKKCWEFVVAHGYCGDEVSDSTGSRAWKKHMREQPILCPPIGSGLADVPPPTTFNNVGCPAQAGIDGVAARVGEWLGATVETNNISLPIDGLLRCFDYAALFPEKYQQALAQAATDVRLCYEEHILPWTSAECQMVCEWLTAVREDISGEWLAERVLSGGTPQVSEARIRSESLGAVRGMISQRAVTVSCLLFVGRWMHTVERTLVEGLAASYNCQVCCADLFSPDSVSLSTLVVLQFDCGREAADPQSFDTPSATAALDSTAVHLNFALLRSLRTLLIAWRPLWLRALQGATVGVSCNGPLWWIQVLQGTTCTVLVPWVLQTTSYGWLLLARPATDTLHG